jgi:hypothetical protein
MFQCKAHLVMRLIENRISMEFMLQVSANIKNLTTLKDWSLVKPQSLFLVTLLLQQGHTS